MTNKLTRKLLLSVLTVAFAFITLGATTFAWFTLSTKAEVQLFETEVTAGAGIEISADGLSYGNSLTAEQIYDAISRSGTSRILDDLTTSDGINFRTITSNSNFDGEPDGGWVEFDLYFRSPEANVEVYMLDTTYITSDGVLWTSDAAFNWRNNEQLLVNQTKRVYGPNALRLSSTEYTVTSNGTELSFTKGETGALIYELNPSGTSADGKANLGNQRLDTTIVSTYGSVAYYNAKNPTSKITDEIIFGDEDNPDDKGQNGRLPQRVLSNVVQTIVLNEGEEDQEEVQVSNLVNSSYLNTNYMTMIPTYANTKVATLSAKLGLYYYGRITIRAWLEGWDPDMYNAIMSDTIKIYMNFGGHAPSSIMDLTLEELGDIEVNSTAQIVANKVGYEGNLVYVSNDENIATVDSTGLVTGKTVGQTYITVYFEEYPNISATVLVNVVEPASQG